jgi:hypothetical protein
VASSAVCAELVRMRIIFYMTGSTINWRSAQVRETAWIQVTLIAGNLDMFSG